MTGLCAFGGFLFLITLYLQDVRGYRPLIAGLFLLPMALVMACSAPLAGRVIARRGTRIPLIISGAGIAACGLLLTFLTATTPVWYVLLCGVVFGVGQGWLNAPITNNAVAGMPRSQAGVAAGIASTGRQVGSLLGVAVMGSVLAANLHGPLAAGFASATLPGWWIITGAGVAVLALALYTTGRAGRASAARTASLITRGDDHIPAPQAAGAAPHERRRAQAGGDRAPGDHHPRWGRGPPARLVVLLICSSSLFITYLDSTILNVALPTIQADLHSSLAGLQWTIDAYLLVIASLLMLSGSTADRVGRRRVFQIGLAVFTVGSLACSLAPSLGALIGFRALQAVGGSMLNPVAMAIIANTFTEPGERAKAIGVWGSVFGLSMALGPIIGGALVDSVGWRGVFWVNIPIGVAAIILTALFVPESRAGTYRRPDPFGQILVMITLSTVTYGIIEGPDYGWASARILACFAVGAVALAAFLWHEPRRDQPLLDLRFFRSLPFSGAALTAVTGLCAFGGFLFLITLYLQDVRGYRPLIAGLFLLPMALVMACSAPLAGRVIARRGTRIPLIISGAGIAAGGLLLTFLTATTPVWYVLLCGVVFGVGQGWLNAPITNNAVAGMPRSQAGVAAGIASTGRQVGSLLGVAVMGSVLAANLHGPLAAGFASATLPGWWIITGAGVAVLALALYTTGRAGRASAARTASLITRGDDHIPAPQAAGARAA